MSFPRVRLVPISLLLATFAVAGCGEDHTVPAGPAPQASESPARSVIPSTDPAAFVDSMRQLDNDNEIIVAVKDADVPPSSPDRFGPDPVLAFPAPPAGVTPRTGAGFAKAEQSSVGAVEEILRGFAVPISMVGDSLPVILARLPDSEALPVMQALLSSPYIDYVEASRLRPVSVTAGPTGNNLADVKHDFHDVQEAWDYTRGSSVRIGILDSGLSEDGSGSWHPDAAHQSVSFEYGVEARGFVPEYGPCSPSSGDCEWRDDFYEVRDGRVIEAHGTHMVGLPGENDNDIDRVGVAPYALTVSLKVLQNCNNTGCGGDIELDDQDWVSAINYAIGDGIEVLSHSFVENGGGSVADALYDAYHQYDILILAGTGNEQCGEWLVQRSYVMGIGALDGNGNSTHCESYEEVSALAGGSTLRAQCTQQGYCIEDGWLHRSAPSGGTSFATATAAGIAGLARAYNSSWDAQTVRNHLGGEASEGIHNKLNAYWAVVGRPPTVTINGPDRPQPNTTESWYANDAYGTAPMSYEWYRDGNLVATTQQYTANTGTQSFELVAKVIDDIDRTAVDTMYVYPCTDICPEGVN